MVPRQAALGAVDGRRWLRYGQGGSGRIVADIFISYARGDAKWVERLAQRLEQAGFSVWWDRNLATGARYLKETETQLRGAKATVVVWSKASVESHWVADEAALARDLGRLAPISIDGTLPPLGFGQYQATNFAGWRDGHDEPLNVLMRALAEKTGQTLALVGPRQAAKRISPIAWAAGALALLLVTLAGAWTSGLFWAQSKAVSVAVLPFTDKSEGGNQGHLANGITVELLTRMRAIGKLKIAGGDWMPAMIKETGGDPKTLGQRLTVAYILDGDLRTEQDTLRITARLTKVDDASIVWSQVYQREKSGIFAIQDDISSKVANALSVALDVGLQSTGYGGTKNFEAYDHFLRGRALRNKGGSETQYIGELQRAVAIDPQYARAWSELAVAFGTVVRLSQTAGQMEAPLKEMDAASARAEALAPKMWFGHTPRGWYYLGRNQWSEADAAHRSALALGEIADPEFYDTFVSFDAQIGRATHGRQMLERMLALDPRHPSRIAWFSNAAALGQSQLFWDEYKASRIAMPDFVYTREYSAFWMALAERDREKAASILTGLSPAGVVHADLAVMLNAPKQGLARVREVASQASLGRRRYSNAALIAGYLGDHELAVALLRRAYLGPGWAGLYPIWFPALAETRQTKGFRDFVRDLGLVEMWRTSNDWNDFCRPTAPDDFVCF